MVKTKAISFLEEARPVQAAEKQKIAKIRKNSIGLLIIWVLLWASVFGLSLFLSNQNKSLLAEKNRLDQNLLQLEDKISHILILKERLGKIFEIIDKRQDFAGPLDNFFASLPPGIRFDSVVVEANEVKVRGVGDIMSISQLAQNYTEKKGDWFQKATLTSLDKEKEALDFSFGLLIEF